MCWLKGMSIQKEMDVLIIKADLVSSEEALQWQNSEKGWGRAGESQEML